MHLKKILKLSFVVLVIAFIAVYPMQYVVPIILFSAYTDMFVQNPYVIVSAFVAIALFVLGILVAIPHDLDSSDEKDS